MAHFDRAILPGREGKVILNLNLRNTQGPIWKSATIVSNDPQKPLVTLDFHGLVRSHIEIRPALLVQFMGTKEKQQEKEVDLITSSQPFKILRIENTLGDKIDYHLQTIVKERHYRIKIINRQKMERYSGMIKCFTTHPKKPEIQILVRFTLEG